MSDLIKEYNQAVGFGQVQGYSRVVAIGHNTDIDASTVPEDMWENGGTYTFLSSASNLEVLSSSANDATGGTGARTAFVSGLNYKYNPISETVTLNGTTPVITTNKYLRVNTFIVNSAGSSETNAGTITLRVQGGGTVQSLIAIGYGIARSAVYTIPAGRTLSVESLFFSMNRAGANQTASVATLFRFPSGNFYRMPLELSVYNTVPYLHHGLPGIIVNEKTDFLLRCTYTSTNNVDLTAGWLGVLKQNGF